MSRHIRDSKPSQIFFEWGSQNRIELYRRTLRVYNSLTEEIKFCFLSMYGTKEDRIYPLVDSRRMNNSWVTMTTCKRPHYLPTCGPWQVPQSDCLISVALGLKDWYNIYVSLRYIIFNLNDIVS